MPNYLPHRQCPQWVDSDICLAKKVLSYSLPVVLGCRRFRVTCSTSLLMILLSRHSRPARPHEWTRGKAVTFIVTLAATGSVTLAARESGMSRKSAYALKSRDSAFAAAWMQALEARPKPRQGDKANEAHTSLVRHTRGDTKHRAAPSISSTRRAPLERRLAEAARDDFFARLAANLHHRPPAAADLLSPSEPLSPASAGRHGWRP